MSRAISPEEIRRLAKMHRPKGWPVFETRHRTAEQSGITKYDPKRIEVPKLVTLRALYIAFHEYGHVICGHDQLNLPGHVEEYQAENYAISLFRIHMLPGIRNFLTEGRAYVRKHITKDQEEGEEIWPAVRRWARAQS